jgi:hypothetical protein
MVPTNNGNPTPLPSQPDQIAALANAQPNQPPVPAPVAITPTATPVAVPAAPAAPTAPAAQIPSQFPATSKENVGYAPSTHGQIFDRILRTFGGGPIRTMVTDPQTGESQMVEQPQSRGQLARSIVAGALTGMFAPTKYVPGVGGAPRVDMGATLGGAFQAGQQQTQQRNAQAQAQQDKALAQKMLVAKNNIDAMRQYAALAHENQQDLNSTIQTYAPIIADIKEYDKNIEDPSQRAELATGLTWQAAQDDPNLKGKLTQNNLIVDGQTTVTDPQTGRVQSIPTYTILNPNAKIQLSQNTIATLDKVNPAWQSSFDVTGGNVRVSARMAIAAAHQASAVDSAENYFERASEALGTPEKQDLMSAIRNSKNRAQLLNAVDQMHTAMASGNPLYQTLAAIRAVPGSAELFTAIGLDTNAVNDYINKGIAADKLAQQGGLGDKTPMPDAEAKLNALGKQFGLTAAEITAAVGKIGAGGMTVGEYRQASDKLQAQFNTNRQAALEHPEMEGAGLTIPKGFVANPNVSSLPSMDLQKDLMSKGVKLPSNFEALYAVGHNAADLKTLPTRVTKGTNQMDAQTGLAFIRQYINPEYQEGDYTAAANLSKELASTKQGTAGRSLLSAGTASNHLELLAQAAEALNNNDVQGLNHLANAVGVQFGKSPAVTFKAIAEQVNQEVGKVVAGGATHEAELQNLRDNLNSDQSPTQVHDVIRSYIGLMSGRINEINDRSQQYFGRDVKGLSSATAKVFAKYGFDAPGYTRVQVNGVVGAIPNAQVKAFRQKYPNAVVSGQ